MLQDQIREFDQAHNSDDKLTKWLNPTVNVLCALSAAVSGGVSLVSLAKVLKDSSDIYILGIFACECDICRHRRLSLSKYPIITSSDIGLTLNVLKAAKDVAASKDVLAELFERIGFFFTRLETYTEVTPTPAMTDIITQIMVEVLKIFGIATKELKRGSASQFPNGSFYALHFH